MSNTTSTAQTPVEASSVDSDGLSTASAVETPDETPGSLDEAHDDEPQNIGSREARYRIRAREAEQQRDALAQQIEQLQARDAERIAGSFLSNPADVFTLGGVQISELVGEDGFVDTEKVTSVVNQILGTRPGLSKQSPATDRSQGHGFAAASSTPSFQELLQQQ